MKAKQTYLCFADRVARKDHQCTGCGHPILTGYRYLDARLGHCRIPGAKARMEHWHFACAKEGIPGFRGTLS